MSRSVRAGLFELAVEEEVCAELGEAVAHERRGATHARPEIVDGEGRHQDGQVSVGHAFADGAGEREARVFGLASDGVVMKVVAEATEETVVGRAARPRSAGAVV